MNPQIANIQDYQKLARNQAILSREVKQLKIKFDLLGSLKKFDRATKQLGAFARKKGITKADVLNDD